MTYLRQTKRKLGHKFGLNIECHVIKSQSYQTRSVQIVQLLSGLWCHPQLINSGCPECDTIRNHIAVTSSQSTLVREWIRHDTEATEAIWNKAILATLLYLQLKINFPNTLYFAIKTFEVRLFRSDKLTGQIVRGKKLASFKSFRAGAEYREIKQAYVPRSLFNILRLFVSSHWSSSIFGNVISLCCTNCNWYRGQFHY